MPVSCEAARTAIETCNFVGWRGLPRMCSSDAVFGVPMDEDWGELPLGTTYEPARSRLLDIEGYYRPMAYVRGGEVVLFEGMNPALAGGWEPLSADLGPPEFIGDWVHGTIDMPGGMRVYGHRGIAILLNPENAIPIHVAVYAPTDAEEYLARLWVNWDKRRASALPGR